LALRMEIAAGVKGREDRLSRVRSHLSVAMPCILLLGLVTLALSGAMKGGRDLVISLDMLAVTVGLLLSGLGVAQVFSALLIYPVPSMDQPFASPQGRAVAQGFLPLLQLLASLVIMLPTFLVALLAMTTVGILPLWLPMPVALANGLIVLAVGVAIGSRIFDRRQSAILLTLDRYASLQS
ncbi:MAG: ABC transporter permease, partial [Bifidobacterium sp.]|nr:ABC transporter permease [Bifidobacterium sp.]